MRKREGENGKTIYHVKNFIQETGDFVDDGLHSIFVNTVCDDGNDYSESSGRKLKAGF